MFNLTSIARLRPRSGYDVLALIGVFVALGSGGAYAAGQIVTSDDVVNESLLSEDVKNGTLTSADLAAAAIGTSQVADGSIFGTDVADNSLTANDIVPNSVGGSRIIDGSIGSVDIADNNLTGADINESTLGEVPMAAKADAAGEVYTRLGGSRTLWNDSIWHEQVSVDLPAGNFMVTAKVQGIENTYEEMQSECRLRLNSALLDFFYDEADEDVKVTAMLMGTVILGAGGKLIVDCRHLDTASSEHDGVVNRSRIIAVKVGDLK